jgi:hypothetical protein
VLLKLIICSTLILTLISLDKFDQLFWDRYKGGELRGEPKDKVPLHGDDELDALCNLVCGPYVWTRHEPKRKEPTETIEVGSGLLSSSAAPASTDSFLRKLQEQIKAEESKVPAGFR